MTWHRTDTGALLLRRGDRVIALVIRLDDRQTYAWLYNGNRSQPYDTEQEACDGLLDRILKVQRSARGTLFLRLAPKETLGVVTHDDATGEYRWFIPHAPKNDAVYFDETTAYQALCDALGLAA